METRWLKFILTILALMSVMSLDAWAQGGRSELCQVSNETKLAKDQRDNLRLSCLKVKKQQWTVPQCLKIANSMEYSINAEEARLYCLNNIITRISVQECLTLSQAMEYPDSGDEVRWECIRHFQKSLTNKQCHAFAKTMSYPANLQRASDFCTNER